MLLRNWYGWGIAGASDRSGANGKTRPYSCQPPHLHRHWYDAGRAVNPTIFLRFYWPNGSPEDRQRAYSVAMAKSWDHMAVHERLRHAQIECVILTASAPEAAFLKNICSVVGIRVHHAATLEDADFLLMATGSAVLLSDVVAVDCSWQSALGMLWDHYPYVKMLVVAGPAEAPFLRDIDAPALSGFIWRPIEFNTVVQCIRAAHQASLDHRKVVDARPGMDASLPPRTGIR